MRVSQSADDVYQGADVADATPEEMLNPKKKVFETIQPVSRP